MQRVFVQARSQPDAVGKLQAHHLDRCGDRVLREEPSSADRGRGVEPRKHKPVRGLGIELEQ